MPGNMQNILTVPYCIFLAAWDDEMGSARDGEIGKNWKSLELNSQGVGIIRGVEKILKNL